MRLKSQKWQREPQRARALWLSAGPGGGWIPLLEAGAEAPAGYLVLCARQWAPGARALAPLLGPVSGLPAPQGDTSPPCLPSRQRQLLPVARALRAGARSHLERGEEAEFPEQRERLGRERRQVWPILKAERPAGPSGACGGGSGGCPRAGLRYSPASGPCLSFGASDRCLTRKSCS